MFYLFFSATDEFTEVLYDTAAHGATNKAFHDACDYKGPTMGVFTSDDEQHVWGWCVSNVHDTTTVIFALNRMFAPFQVHTGVVDFAGRVQGCTWHYSVHCRQIHHTQTHHIQLDEAR